MVNMIGKQMELYYHNTTITRYGHVNVAESIKEWKQQHRMKHDKRHATTTTHTHIYA